MNTSIKALETTLHYQGRTLRQIRRQDQVALYELYGPGDVLYGFEVVIVKVLPAEIIHGKAYPEREAYPSSAKGSDDWGSIAFSYCRNDRAGAEARFAGLVKTQPAKRASDAQALLFKFSACDITYAPISRKRRQRRAVRPLAVLPVWVRHHTCQSCHHRKLSVISAAVSSGSIPYFAQTASKFWRSDSVGETCKLVQARSTLRYSTPSS